MEAKPIWIYRCEGKEFGRKHFFPFCHIEFEMLENPRELRDAQVLRREEV